MNPEQREVQIPGVKLPIWGLKAEYHQIRHQNKLAKYPLDAGFDIYPSEIEKVTSHSRVRVVWVHTFLHVGVGAGFKGLLDARSSSVDKLNGGLPLRGLIDAGYTGELMIRVYVPDAFMLEAVHGGIVECQKQGVAIAQFTMEHSLMIIAEAIDPAKVRQVGRGSNGFGSSDKLHT